MIKEHDMHNILLGNGVEFWTKLWTSMDSMENIQTKRPGAMSPHFSDITKQTPVHQEKVSSADNSVNKELEDIKQNGR